MLLSVKMKHLSLDAEQRQNQVQWRRDKVQKLCTKDTAKEISYILQVGLDTVNRDTSYLRNQAENNIRTTTNNNNNLSKHDYSVFIFHKVQICNPFIYRMK
jgi:hypothetical protein